MTDTPKPPKITLGVRVTPAGRDWLATLAAERGEPISDTVRAILQHAAAGKFPRTYKVQQ